MQQRRLGQNGPMTSAIGVGAMSFSDFYGPTTEAASHAILRAALELGVSHIDTSNVYGMGRSETEIGTFLKAHPDARDQFQIATKAAITRDADGNRYFDNSAAHLEAELDKSLARMGVEQVDLFYGTAVTPECRSKRPQKTLPGWSKQARPALSDFRKLRRPVCGGPQRCTRLALFNRNTHFPRDLPRWD